MIFGSTIPTPLKVAFGIAAIGGLAYGGLAIAGLEHIVNDAVTSFAQSVGDFFTAHQTAEVGTTAGSTVSSTSVTPSPGCHMHGTVEHCGSHGLGFADHLNPDVQQMLSNMQLGSNNP